MILRLDMLPRSLAAVARSLWARIRGYEILAPEETREARLDECLDCEEIRHGLAGDQCRRCGCFVDAKTYLAVESCPRKKWAAVWLKKKLTPSA